MGEVPIVTKSAMDKEIKAEFEKLHKKLEELEIKSNFHKRWTKEDDKILRKYYKTMKSKGIGKMLGRTRIQITSRISYLKVMGRL